MLVDHWLSIKTYFIFKQASMSVFICNSPNKLTTSIWLVLLQSFCYVRVPRYFEANNFLVISGGISTLQNCSSAKRMNFYFENCFNTNNQSLFPRSKQIWTFFFAVKFTQRPHRIFCVTQDFPEALKTSLGT